MALVRLNVNVNTQNIAINAQLSWSIHQLKQHLYTRLPDGAAVQDLRIIFAGSELQDTVLLRNCRFAQGTVLHAIQLTAVEGQQPVAPVDIVEPTIGDSGLLILPANVNAKRARFYVYCKNHCENVRAGKLRVRCAFCKSSAFELSREPDCWEDIEQARRVRGRCSTGAACPGTYAEFYFRCDGHNNDLEQEMVLKLLRTNTQDRPCLTCTDVSEDIVLVFPNCNHVMCLECFDTYCRTNINQRGFTMRENGYTLPCPHTDQICRESFIEDTHHFLISGKDEYERYKHFAAEQAVLMAGGLLCPGRGCGNGLLPENNNRMVRCRPGCGLVFCRECMSDYHEGACQNPNQPQAAPQNQNNPIDPENANQARWQDEESSSQEAIGRISKRCPGCQANTQKNGGCNHMTCTRCRKHWCWVCVIEWNGRCKDDHWFTRQ